MEMSVKNISVIIFVFLLCLAKGMTHVSHIASILEKTWVFDQLAIKKENHEIREIHERR
jgi:hypothetical protein